jgi:hypothetical protein
MQPYTLTMTTGQEIPISADEYQRVMNGLKEGVEVMVLSNGVFRTKLFGTILPNQAYQDEVNYFEGRGILPKGYLAEQANNESVLPMIEQTTNLLKLKDGNRSEN